MGGKKRVWYLLVLPDLFVAGTGKKALDFREAECVKEESNLGVYSDSMESVKTKGKTGNMARLRNSLLLSVQLILLYRMVEEGI